MVLGVRVVVGNESQLLPALAHLFVNQLLLFRVGSPRTPLLPLLLHVLLYGSFVLLFSLFLFQFFQFELPVPFFPLLLLYLGALELRYNKPLPHVLDWPETVVAQGLDVADDLSAVAVEPVDLPLVAARPLRRLLSQKYKLAVVVRQTLRDPQRKLHLAHVE